MNKKPFQDKYNFYTRLKQYCKPLFTYSEYKFTIVDKQLFYNTYNNPVQLWGVENFNLNTTYRLLTDVMDVFTIPRIKFGEKISPYSVTIIDDQDDANYIIVDDGNENLILSGSYFSTYQEIEFTDI